MKDKPTKQPKALHPTILRQYLARNYDLTSLRFLSHTPTPAVLTQLRKGNATPLCEMLTQMGPGLLADASIREALHDLWIRAPTDHSARRILLTIGEALARVRPVGQPPHRTAAERQHASAISRSVALWRQRYEDLKSEKGEREARKLTLMTFDYSERIKDPERKALIRKMLLEKIDGRK